MESVLPSGPPSTPPARPAGRPRPAQRGDPALGTLACFAVYSAGHAFNRVYKAVLNRLGLTYPQYLVMVLLWQEDGQTVGRICERMLVEASTVTPLLQRLEAQGLIRRVRDRADRRVVWAVLTDKGRQLQEAAADVPECVRAASGHTEQSLSRLTEDIARLRDNLACAASLRPRLG